MIRSEPVPAVQRASEVLLPFDYGLLSKENAGKAREAAVFIEERQKATTTAILEIGRKLLDVKAALGHGHFGAWLLAEFDWSERSARNYMQAAEVLADKTATVADLPPTTLYRLAAAPEPIREKVFTQIDVARKSNTPMAGERIDSLLVKAKEEAKAAREEAKLTPKQRTSRGRCAWRACARRGASRRSALQSAPDGINLVE